jgi:hypothetical protein
MLGYLVEAAIIVYFICFIYLIVQFVRWLRGTKVSSAIFWNIIFSVVFFSILLWYSSNFGPCGVTECESIILTQK